MNPMDALSPRLLGLRQHLQVHRENRSTRRSLERDLASYSSARDLYEWDAILSRYDDTDADAATIRDILSRNRAA